MLAVDRVSVCLAVSASTSAALPASHPCRRNADCTTACGKSFRKPPFKWLVAQSRFAVLEVFSRTAGSFASAERTCSLSCHAERSATSDPNRFMASFNTGYASPMQRLTSFETSAFCPGLVALRDAPCRRAHVSQVSGNILFLISVELFQRSDNRIHIERSRQAEREPCAKATNHRAITGTDPPTSLPSLMSLP